MWPYYALHFFCQSCVILLPRNEKHQKYEWQNQRALSSTTSGKTRTYGAEGWTMKKSDSNRSEAFEMWCWRIILVLEYDGEHGACESILNELNTER